MGSGKSEHNQQLIGLAQRRAFETYLRFGRMPDDGPLAVERKAVNPLVATPMVTPSRATRYYVWRSTGDDRVRSSHAARNGQIFSWAEPPSGGHPGTESNCRCWPEPYYGDPSIPDALQPLWHSRQVSTDGTTRWASIETLTRSDGSVAQSVAVDRDGTQIWSRFAGTTVEREIALSSGQIVHVDASAGLQSVYLGNDSRPLFQSAWTASGPKVIRTQQRVAFLGDPDTLIDPNTGPGPLEAEREPGVVTVLPNISGLIALALVALYSIQQEAPASQGLGETDEPVLAVKAWTVDGKTQPVPILVDSLTEEQLRQHCRFLPDVQTWTDDAAALLAEQKPILPARTWGSLVHGAVKRTIDALKASMPLIYRNLYPEISFSPDTVGDVPYSQRGSTRLDVVEDRSKDLGAVCDYDIKTGREGLIPKRLKEIAERLSARYPGSIIYIIEVRPRP